MEASLYAKIGRIHGCTRTLRKTSDSSCTAGAVHTWPKTIDLVPQQNVGLRGQTGSDGRSPEMTLMIHCCQSATDFAVMQNARSFDDISQDPFATLRSQPRAPHSTWTHDQSRVRRKEKCALHHNANDLILSDGGLQLKRKIFLAIPREIRSDHVAQSARVIIIFSGHSA